MVTRPFKVQTIEQCLLGVLYNFFVFQTGPGMIPLQSLGMVDAGATYVGEHEILVHALANASSSEMEDSQLIRWSSEFVNKYGCRDQHDNLTDSGPDNPNHMMGTFVMLWPYGVGGIEAHQPINVSYDVHVCALLQRDGKQFQQHHNCIFQAFGILQKHQFCSSAGLQVQKRAFIKNQQAFQALTPKDLMITTVEKSRKAPISNLIVKALHSQISGLRAKVMGTDELRIKIRGQIKGMCVMKGPPSLWLTINPSDTADLIAQVLVGEGIDMDSFVKISSSADIEQWSATIAADPYVIVKFFHFVIAVLLEELFSIIAHRRGTQVMWNEGIFENVALYIGMVKAQGQGTLHLHMIVWLVGSLTSAKMQQTLKSNSF